VDANCGTMVASHAASIAVGPDGLLWLNVVDYRGMSTIGASTTAGGGNGTQGISLGQHAAVPVAGPDGALWFTENKYFNANFPSKIGRYGPLPSSNNLVSAVLPLSRSVQVGSPSAAFATIINTGTSPAIGCMIVPGQTVPASYVFQTTDPATNSPTGTANAPATIPAGGSQSFVVVFTPTAAFAPTDVK